ncbi:MAG: scyllo-inositol 2-dehydrogenase, partial [Frankiaceae bacterium]|nr:scyllo-inositol 2-dehydrogenase [Frankiaceae bacterium]
MIRLAVLSDVTEADLAGALAGLLDHLRSCGVEIREWPAPGDAVLVFTDRPLARDQLDALVTGLGNGVPLLLAGPTLAAQPDPDALAEATGVITGRPTPVHQLRLRPGPEGGGLSARLDGDIIVTDRWLQLEKVLDDVDVLLTAMVGLSEQPVMTWRPATRVGLLSVGVQPQTLADPSYRRVVHRWLRHALTVGDRPDVRVALLGYGAIGAEHAAAIAAVDGLQLHAVCDKSPTRLEAARLLAPDVAAYGDGDDLLRSADVDLVIVSTPPNTHADWALRALDAGKHVVVEKPFCLTVDEADRQIAAAADRGLTLAVYQNRRWDPDYLALKNVVRSGVLGDVFHYESFVGGFG